MQGDFEIYEKDRDYILKHRKIIKDKYNVCIERAMEIAGIFFFFLHKSKRSRKDVFKKQMDIFASICASIAQCVVGMPFDTCKVLLQGQERGSQPRSKLSIIRQTIKKPSHLYRGAMHPFLAASLSNSILFPTYERVTPHVDSPFLAGGVGGLLVSPILFVFDCYKIQRQSAIRFPVHPWRSRGMIPNTVREMAAFAIYFSVYDAMMQRDWGAFISGGVAGLCNWGATFPIDTLKTRQIMHQIPLRQALLQGNLYQGYGVCLLRAVIVNACIFKTYDFVLGLN